MNRNELLELIPAYSLGALDDNERAQVEALLASDEEAQQLLDDYDAIIDILPLTVPVRQAPSHLRADLRSRLESKLSQTISVADHSYTTDSIAEHQPDGAPDSSNRIIALPTIIATIAAIVVVAIGILFVLQDNATVEVSPNQQLFDELLDTDGSTRFSITPGVAEDVEGELVVSPDGQQAVLRIATLPDATSDESYQLWLIAEDNVESGGIFHWATGHGPYYVVINHPIEQLVSIGMTIEPFEGSPLGNAPSGERLFGVAVAQAE